MSIVTLIDKNLEVKGMDWIHSGYVTPRETWNEFEGKRIQFSSNHRPHARYFSWQNYKTMLSQSWKGKDNGAKDAQMRGRGKKFWGTRGPYIKNRILLAFVEQLGYDYEALIENAIVKTKNNNVPESDPFALLLASAEI